MCSAALSRSLLTFISVLAFVFHVVEAGENLGLGASGTPGMDSGLKKVVLSNQTEGLCLDGSPPAYYFRPGSGSNKNNWLIHVQGGYWCFSPRECAGRSHTPRGSSTLWPAPSDRNFTSILQKYNSRFQGILSSSMSENPIFYNWNLAEVIYCDGGSFAGNNFNAVYQNFSFHMTGQHNLQLVISDLLLTKGLSRNTSKIVFAGSSAGGLAIAMATERISHMLNSTSADIRILVDAGFFVDVRNHEGRHEFRGRVRHGVSLHRMSGSFPSACRDRFGQHWQMWRCFFPGNSLLFSPFPVLVINSYFDSVALHATVLGDDAASIACVTSFPSFSTCTGEQKKAVAGHKSEIIRNLSLLGAALGQRGVNLTTFIFYDRLHCIAVTPLFTSAVDIAGQKLTDVLKQWVGQN